MNSKEILVARLLEDKSITAEEAVVLLRETVVFPDPKLTKLLPYVDIKGDNEMVPYGTICSCNPANGGSGICGCVMGNKLVPINGITQFHYTTDVTSEYKEKKE